MLVLLEALASQPSTFGSNMAVRKVLVGGTDALTGIVAHGTFVAGDRITDPAGTPLVQPSWVYGTGANGTTTISTNTTLTGNIDYENLTVAAGVVLNTGGYLIRVRDTLTMENGSRIMGDGNSASGSNAGSAAVATFFGNGNQGTNGAVANSGNSAAVTGYGGRGGRGGASGARTAGTTGLVNAPADVNGGSKGHTQVLALLTGLTPGVQKLLSGTGGTGGGGDGASNSGGGGGASGRFLAVIAHRILVLDGTATISANGGNGANGATNAGGGGGGGGGVAIVVSTYEQPEGLTVEAAGGTGGLGNGTGLNGNNGSAGFAAYYRAR